MSAKGQIAEIDAAVQALRANVKAQRVDALIHNLNSLMQIVSGQVTLLSRDYPEEKRCAKLSNGVQRLVNTISCLKGRCDIPSKASDLAKHVKSTFNSLSTSADSISIRVTGDCFPLKENAAIATEAFLLALLQACAAGSNVTIAVKSSEGAFECILSEPAEFPDQEAWVAILADVGVDLHLAANPLLIFHSDDVQGI